MDIALPRLRFAEPAGERRTLPAFSGSKSPTDKGRGRNRCGAVALSGVAPSCPRPRPRHAVIVLSGRLAAPVAGNGADGDGCVFDAPRFASTLKRLTAVKTRLWNRWDLSTFPRLTALDVSFAGRTMLEQLHRKVCRRESEGRGWEGGGGAACSGSWPCCFCMTLLGLLEGAAGSRNG